MNTKCLSLLSASMVASLQLTITSNQGLSTVRYITRRRNVPKLFSGMGAQRDYKQKPSKGKTGVSFTNGDCIGLYSSDLLIYIGLSVNAFPQLMFVNSL
ncbi:hypothetical protein PF008_g13104 [Phytophthora fragariae]|uniref:RxLR effector protein n=1 Tax=Phytophthora fragariae TaxID=53985 RepID=A0A6G0RKW7_9STRA|nr:hypothetical protein PF008_g13104 [Phytophthora fragariae]